MRSDTRSIKNIFIKRMIYSAFIQFLVMGVILVLIKNYFNHDRLSSLHSSLIVNDSFTTEVIGKYYLLKNKYALALELNNLADERKLDSANFFIHLNSSAQLNKCSNFETNGFKVCELSSGVFLGISPVKLDQKIIGYVVTKKKYNLVFPVTLSRGLLLIFIFVFGIFLFNFLLLFLSIKKNIEGNTKKLLDFISHKTDSAVAIPHLTIDEYMSIAKKFVEERAEIASLQKDKAYYEARKNIAAQVAHDIRSPLSAINTAISSVKEIPEKRRVMIKNASKRINDIANNLLAQYKSESNIENTQHASSELMFVVIDSIVAEKRYEYGKKQINIALNISKKSYGCFAKIDLISFKRVLSNLINNSVEAIDSNGHVTVKMDCDDQYVEIMIEDNGCGIPPDLISQVTLHRFSYKKPSGAGFGLSYAKQYVEHVNGKIFIDSTISVGTKVSIKLLRSSSPTWFCQEISIAKNSNVVVLDDDPSIHETWKIKLADIDGINIIDYSNASHVTPEAIIKNDANLYLVDYELLGNITTGLDVINKYGLSKKAILVTSSFEDGNVRVLCESMGVKIIPKSFVPYIPVISRTIHKKKSTIVLIDDDEMMRMTWEFAAEEAGHKIDVFSSPDQFNKLISNYDANTKIYIDSELENGIKGEIYAKELYEKGFAEIYLTTGHPKYKFKDMYWIKSIISKDPHMFG